MATGRAIGIDLGTTNTCAACVENGEPRIIRSGLGNHTIPSVLTFDDRGEPVIGEAAARRMVLQPTETVFGSKRLIGRTYRPDVVARLEPHFPFPLVKDDDGFIAAKVGGRIVPAIQAAELILREIRGFAQRSLGERVSRAVITVPAYFNENQRALVREAGRRAELDVIRIINEPTAAALTYGRTRREKKRLLVFDLGGGTFDVSVIELDGNVYTVRVVDGDTFLGGIDFDHRLVDMVSEALARKHRRDIELDPVSRERLRVAAQEAKHTLSVQQKTILQLPHFALRDGTTIDVAEQVNRVDFEEATRELWERTLTVTQRTLDCLDLGTNDFDEVVLVGGQTRMPILQSRLRTMFGLEPSKQVHPDEAVALGAAIAADSENQVSAAVLLDVLPLPIWLVESDGRQHQVLEANTPVPTKAVANVMVPPGCTRLRFAVFQGETMRYDACEYLGALELDGFPPPSNIAECQIQLALDAESILTLRAVCAALNVDQDVKLATRSTPDQVLSTLGMERIRKSDKKPLGKSSGAGRGAAKPAGWFKRLIARFRG
ncbi:MAG: Hsp70 family protein [bacterium]